jgi:hypothetical protein
LEGNGIGIWVSLGLEVGSLVGAGIVVGVLVDRFVGLTKPATLDTFPRSAVASLSESR